MELTQEAVRAVMIAATGLHGIPPEPVGKQHVLDTIRRMGVLQIDTINVVARSPYLVLWSRLGDYSPAWLDELHAEGALFEYWAHAMCFIPIEDYALFRRQMLDVGKAGEWWAKWTVKWAQEHPEVMDKVRARLRENGSARSVEFVNKDRPPGGWWNWKDEKNALEVLLLNGEAMIARREKFQRVYGLREQILPDWDDAQVPDMETVQRELILKGVRALGIATPRSAPDYYRLRKNGVAALLGALAEEGRLLRIAVDGWEEPAYAHPDHAGLVAQAAAGGVRPQRTTLLSPFDPLVWDRERARTVFGFDYTIECYLPAAKRRYGYFTLPILHEDRLVGRLDPKAHRKEGLLEVKSVHLEPGVKVTDELVDALAGTLRAFGRWQDTPRVVVGRSDPEGLAERLNGALARSLS